MNRLRFLASLALAPWFLTVLFFAGPVRWELAHGCQMALQPLGPDLPTLTARFTLPVLGVTGTGAMGLVNALLFWAFIWLGAVWLIVLIWRSTTREDLLERFIFGAAFYFGSVFSLVSLVFVGLWLPFIPLAFP